MFVLFSSPVIVCGASVISRLSRKKRSYFDSLNKFLAFITPSENSLTSPMSMALSKAHIYYIITYIEKETGCSYLPDAPLVCPLASTDAPLFPNFVGRTPWRAEIIRGKDMNHCSDQGAVEDGLNPRIELRLTTKEKDARNFSLFSVLRAPSVFYLDTGTVFIFLIIEFLIVLIFNKITAFLLNGSIY